MPKEKLTWYKSIMTWGKLKGDETESKGSKTVVNKKHRRPPGRERVLKAEKWEENYRGKRETRWEDFKDSAEARK